MPATALRHPEIEADAFDAPAPSITYAPPARRAAPLAPPEENVEWREVAPLVERFTGAPSDTERRKRRSLKKRHRTFVMSGVFVAGTLLFSELVGLVWLTALNSSAGRHYDALQKQESRIELEMALSNSQLAASVSPARLDAWAGPLGYHKAGPTEMDDVTTSVAAPAPAKPKIP